MQRNFSSVPSKCSTDTTQSLSNIKILKENKRLQKSLKLINFYCLQYSGKQQGKSEINSLNKMQGNKLSLNFIDFCAPKNIKYENPQKLMKLVYKTRNNIQNSDSKPISLKLRINSKELAPTFQREKTFISNSKTYSKNQHQMTDGINQGQISFKNSGQLMKKSEKSTTNLYNNRSQMKKYQQESESLINNKIKQVVKQFYINVEIFKKILCEVKRKKQIMQKIYGWNKNFNQILFVNNNSINVHHQEANTNLNKKINNYSSILNIFVPPNQDLIMFSDLQDIIENLNINKERLGIDKKYFCQKLKLFNRQLMQFNEKQHNLQTQQRKNRIKERIFMISTALQKFRNSPIKQKQQYYSRIKTSQKNLGIMKQKIHNKKENIKKIEQETGKLKICEFEIEVQNKINQLESVISNSQKEISLM